MFSFRPSFLSLNKRPSFQTRSKAFSKSKKTARVSCFVAMDFKISSCNLRIWSRQPLPRLKPHWLRLKSWFFSMYQPRRSATTRSIILHIQEVRAIGRYESGLDFGLLGLGIGKITECFHWVGRRPVVQIKLKRLRTGLRQVLGICFRIS